MCIIFCVGMFLSLTNVFVFFRFKAVAAKSKLDLVSEGFTEFTIEDFHNTVSGPVGPFAVSFLRSGR